MFQSTEFTPMMTARAPEARAHSHSRALRMLSACWLNGPRGPIKEAQRRQVMQETSRRSNRSCRAASVTLVPTRRRERTTSPRHDEAYLLYFRHVKNFFLLWCVFFFLLGRNQTLRCFFLGGDNFDLLSAHYQGMAPSASFSCVSLFFLNLTKLEPPNEQSSCLKSKLCKYIMQSTLFWGLLICYSKIFAHPRLSVFGIQHINA